MQCTLSLAIMQTTLSKKKKWEERKERIKMPVPEADGGRGGPRTL